ncbi:MAG: hypothetical protein KIS89_10735 [Dokdonella sp.]|nr:hypothetical protein [Dokdonella sp.]
MRTLTLILLMLASSTVSAGSIATSLKDLDEGTRASVVKELSKIHRYQDNRRDRRHGAAATDGQTGDGCDMNVASQPTPSRTGATPRRVVTVVTGNIVQLCNR